MNDLTALVAFEAFVFLRRWIGLVAEAKARVYNIQIAFIVNKTRSE